MNTFGNYVISVHVSITYKILSNNIKYSVHKFVEIILLSETFLPFLWCLKLKLSIKYTFGFRITKVVFR
jgi:hypothetical protein